MSLQSLLQRYSCGDACNKSINYAPTAPDAEKLRRLLRRYIFEVTMRSYFLIAFTSVIFFSSYVRAESVSSGTYTNLLAEKGGKVGKLLLHPVENDRFMFSLKLNRGKPSYNSGHLFGELQFKGAVAIYESSEFKFKNERCVLAFEKNGDLMLIKTVDSNKQCGFGFGVYADGEYSLTSNVVPESYIDTLGNTVKFP